MTEFLRVSGIYWGLTAMDLIGQLERMNKQQVLEYVISCHDAETGGFSPAVRHDPHLLYTLSAVQVRSFPLHFYSKMHLLRYWYSMIPSLWLIGTKLFILCPVSSNLMALLLAINGARK